MHEKEGEERCQTHTHNNITSLINERERKGERERMKERWKMSVSKHNISSIDEEEGEGKRKHKSIIVKGMHRVLTGEH